MSELHEDPAWQDAARRVGRELDRNDVRGAQELMRKDLWQLQNDPHAQHEFINMVNRYDQKGVGADLMISRGPNGQEMWQIMPANYGYNDGRYPVPVPPPERMPMPAPPPDVVVVQPQRPSAGDRFVDGLATGAGVGIGIGIMGRIFDGGHRR